MLNQLILNDVVEEISSEEKYRIIYIDKVRNIITLVKLNTLKLEIKNKDLDKLEKVLQSGLFCISPNNLNYNLIEENQMSSTILSKFQQKKQIIEELLKYAPEPFLYERRYRSSAIKRISSSMNISERMVRRTLTTYLQDGKSNQSLLPNYTNCGGRGKDRLSNTKVGKVRKKVHLNEYVSHTPISNGVPMTIEDIKNINKAINLYLIGNTGISIAKAYRIMIEKVYTKLDEWGNPIQINSDNIPSYDQFYYQVKKMRKSNYTGFTKKQLGEKKFNLTARAGQSNTVVDALIPGFRYEVDATRPHILMLDKHRKNVIGTPVVFYVVDTFTKIIVGLSVGLDAPSWNGASSALMNVVEDKVDFAGRYDVSITPDEWINTTLPQNILADNGEFAGNLPLDLINQLGVSIENAPSGRGDLKGNVEKMFHLTEQELFGLLPGFSKKNYRERSETDTNQKARLTLRDVTEAYIRFVIFHNNKAMKHYPATQEMISDKLNLTPNSIWRWSQENIGVYQVNHPIAEVRYALLRTGKAVITAKGVRLFGIHYHADIAHEEGWFTRAKALGVEKVQAKYDERNLNFIYMKHQTTGKLILLTQTEASFMQFGDISLAEKEYYDAMKKIANIENKDDQLLIQNEFYRRIFDLNDMSNELYKETNFKNKPNSTEKRANRKAENTVIRKEQSIMPDEVEVINLPLIEKMPVASGQETYKQKRKRIMNEQIREIKSRQKED